MPTGDTISNEENEDKKFVIKLLFYININVSGVIESCIVKMGQMSRIAEWWYLV